VRFVALVGERNKPADSAKDVMADTSRAMRILLSDELSDLGNILRFARVELTTPGLSSFEGRRFSNFYSF
jgi:hypothetical protein